MPVEVPCEIEALRGVDDALADIRSANRELDSFFNDVLGEFDALAAELESRQRHLAATARVQQAAEDSARETNDHALAELLDEMRAEREALQRAGAEAAAQSQQLAATLQNWAEQREQVLRNEEPSQAVSIDLAGERIECLLADLRGQTQRLDEVQQVSQQRSDELTQALEQIGRLREEMIAQCQQLQQASRCGEGADDAQREEENARREAQIEHLRGRLEQMSQQQAELHQERSLLENELETVRARAAEMGEAMSELRRQAAAQQKGWAGEIRHLRALLEGLSNRAVQPVAAAAPVAAPEPAPAAAPVAVSVAQATPVAEPPAANTAEPAAPTDAVLDNVMAQFEMLQRDLARRRMRTRG